MKVLFKRPILLLIIAIVMLFYSIIEYNLLLPLLFSFFAIGTGNFFESAMSLIQLIFGIITSPLMLSKEMVLLTGVIIAAALVTGVLFGGIFNIINNVLDKKPKFKEEFLLGVKKYFLKLFTINIRVAFSAILMIIFNTVVCVPAIAATRTAAQGNLEFIAGVFIIDIVTICVVFFSFLYYRAYILFWYPSALKYPSKAFTHGKHFVDRNFWKIAKRISGYDIVFLIFGGAFLIGKLALMHDESMNFFIMFILLLLDWVFKTVFFGVFMIYVFSYFKRHSEEAEGQN